MVWTQYLLFRFNDEWSRAVCSFAERLSGVLGDLLVGVVASPKEDLLFHGCNVVVVVKEDTIEVRRKIVEVEREIEKQHNWKIGITPTIVKEGEESVYLGAFR